MKANSQIVKEITSLTNLPWEEVEKISKNGTFKKKFEKIDKATFLFAAQKKNRSTLIESALKSLQRTDHEHATHENAERLADIMQNFARMFLERLI